MENGESSNADGKMAKNASIYPSEKEQNEDTSVQILNKKFERLGDENGQQVADLGPPPLKELLETYKRRLENVIADLQKVTTKNIELQKEKDKLQNEIEEIRTKGRKAASHSIKLQFELSKLRERYNKVTEENQKLKMIKCQENEKNFGDDQQRKSEDQTIGNMAESSTPHETFDWMYLDEHSLVQDKLIEQNKEMSITVKCQGSKENMENHLKRKNEDEKTENITENTSHESFDLNQDGHDIGQHGGRYEQVAHDLDTSESQPGNQAKNRQITYVLAVITQLKKVLDNPEKVSDYINSLIQHIKSFLRQYTEMKKENDDIKACYSKDLIYQIEMENKIDELKKKIAMLEDKMKGDQEDGKRQKQETKKTTECVPHIENEGELIPVKITRNTAETFSPEILPSVSKTPRDVHRNFINPFRCLASCTLSTAFFLMEMTEKKKLCSVKFNEEKGKQLNERKSKEQDKRWEKCCFSFEALANIGLIHRTPLYSGESITRYDVFDEKLQKGAEEMDKAGVLHALIKIVYGREKGFRQHCMSISRFNENPPRCVEIFDAQSESLWPSETEDTKNISAFIIHRMNNEKVKEFAAKCAIDCCIKEYREANPYA